MFHKCSKITINKEVISDNLKEISPFLRTVPLEISNLFQVICNIKMNTPILEAKENKTQIIIRIITMK